MCEDWLNNFKSFYDWCIENGWQKGMHVDKDIKAREKAIEALLYSPEYCSIVSMGENIRNTRHCNVLEFNGEKKNIGEWSKYLGVHQSTLSNRIHILGWTLDRALSKDVDIYAKAIHPPKTVYCPTLQMTFPSAKQAARELGMHQGDISRVCRGEALQKQGLVFNYIQ